MCVITIPGRLWRRARHPHPGCSLRARGARATVCRDKNHAQRDHRLLGMDRCPRPEGLWQRPRWTSREESSSCGLRDAPWTDPTGYGVRSPLPRTLVRQPGARRVGASRRERPARGRPVGSRGAPASQATVPARSRLHEGEHLRPTEHGRARVPCVRPRAKARHSPRRRGRCQPSWHHWPGHTRRAGPPRSAGQLRSRCCTCRRCSASCDR